jgi:hypothetical protein
VRGISDDGVEHVVGHCRQDVPRFAVANRYAVEIVPALSGHGTPPRGRSAGNAYAGMCVALGLLVRLLTSFGGDVFDRGYVVIERVSRSFDAVARPSSSVRAAWAGFRDEYRFRSLLEFSAKVAVGVSHPRSHTSKEGTEAMRGGGALLAVADLDPAPMGARRGVELARVRSRIQSPSLRRKR